MPPYIPSLPPVTPAESAALQRKKTASAATHALYQQYDYLDAYALHTDMRVVDDGPAAAIGGDWEAGGQRQFDFLRAQGVTPASRVLDFGCGTGRLARYLVPYLEPGHYTGMDISMQALVALQQLAYAEGWDRYGFTLLSGDGTLAAVAGEHYDVIFAYSVFVHLPTVVLEPLLASLQTVHFQALYFTYKSAVAPCRSALKQFAAPLAWYHDTARRYGYRVEKVEGRPHLPQPLGVVTCL